MPTCDPLILTPACREIIRLQPSSVLDIGIGFGKWGLLVREYAEVWKHHRLYKKDWKVRLVGVEIHHSYRTPAWGVYDAVLDIDATFLPQCLEPAENEFDLGIMIDVIEHIPKDKAAPFLQWLKGRCKHIIISYSNHPQKDVGDNPHEDHVSLWCPADLPGCKTFLAGDEKHWGLYLLS